MKMKIEKKVRRKIKEGEVTPKIIYVNDVSEDMYRRKPFYVVVASDDDGYIEKVVLCSSKDKANEVFKLKCEKYHIPILLRRRTGLYEMDFRDIGDTDWVGEDYVKIFPVTLDADK